MGEENWGRWGAADERGALNWLTPERVVAAAGLVRSGRVFTLGRPIARETPVAPHRLPPARYMDRDGGDYACGAKRPGGFQFAEDTIHLSTHSGTHIDALAHAWYGDQLYNGFPGNTIRSTTGAQRCGIEKAGPLVGRGVLLDLAGHLNVPGLPISYEVSAAELAACAREQGVDVSEGDIVLLRTGWRYADHDVAEYFNCEPGPGPAAARWLAGRRVAAAGADNGAFEVLPPKEGSVLPVHQFLIRDCGVPLLEGLLLDDLAQARVYEFLFVATPLPIVGGTGSPTNPIAVL